MRFFFYGTLIAGGGTRTARLAQAVLQARGPGRIGGVLYGIADPRGWYPALLPAGESVGGPIVHGVLYEARSGFTAEDLARFDAYEDYDPTRPVASLYIREAAAVTDPHGGVSMAETYRFNQPLPAGSRPIPGGDFHTWLAAEGLRAFGG